MAIPNRMTLDIDFTDKHFLIKSSNDVLIKSTGKIF
ncbi:MAG: hypothetical protein HW410_1230 [Nitrosarchaeum sp.]|nr:hypothetical protein [Nitrosarchaeum sp.]